MSLLPSRLPSWAPNLPLSQFLSGHSSNPSPIPEDEECDILTLADRLPAIEDVIAGLKNHHRVQSILTTPGVLISNQLVDWFVQSYFDHDPYLDDDFWTVAWESMYEAILDNTPDRQSQVKSCKDNYLLDIDYLIASHFSERSFPEFDGPKPDDFVEKLMCLSNVIGWVFVDYFESLIAMPGGRKVIPIEMQLDECLKDLEFKPLEEYFEDGVEKIVYYCAGFLCHAGQTAAS